MNARQRTVLKLGALAAVLLLLFPPKRMLVFGSDGGIDLEVVRHSFVLSWAPVLGDGGLVEPAGVDGRRLRLLLQWLALAVVLLLIAFRSRGGDGGPGGRGPWPTPEPPRAPARPRHRRRSPTVRSDHAV